LKKEKENDKKKDSTDHFTQNVLRNLWENARNCKLMNQFIRPPLE
jgi:hypothetical protein